MPINISSQFDLKTQLPLRKYTVVSNTTNRDAIPTINRYDGFTTYVEADNKTYQLQGGITNSDWAEFGGSSLSFGTDNQIPHMNSGGTDFDYDSKFKWASNTLVLNTGTTDLGVYIGSGAGVNVDDTNDGWHVGIGYNALNSITNGEYNYTAIGYRAGEAADGGGDSVFLGTFSGYQTTSPYGNTFLGAFSGFSNITGEYNTYVGIRSGNISTGSNNVFIGSESGRYETESNKFFIDNQDRTNEATARTSSMLYGGFNSTVKDQFLRVNGRLDINDELGNTRVGLDAGISITTGDNNSIFGHYAGYSITTGKYNTLFGKSCGTGKTDTDYSTQIGYQSGGANNVASSVYIGAYSGFRETDPNKLFIDNQDRGSEGGSRTDSLIYGIFNSTVSSQLLRINGNAEINSGTLFQDNGTIADNDATPDVTGANIWTYAGSANSVTITDLDNPQVGAIYTIIGNSSTYTISIDDFSNFNLKGGDWVGGLDESITLYCQADNDYIELSRNNPTEIIQFAVSDEVTSLTTGTDKMTFRMPFRMKLYEVRASLTGAGSTSGTTAVDINEGGTTILSTKLSIDYGEKTSTTAAAAAIISDDVLADDAEITIDIDGVTGGGDETGLKVALIGVRI